MKKKLLKFLQVDRELTIVDKILLIAIGFVIIPTFLLYAIVSYPLNLLTKPFRLLWKRKQK